MARHGIPDKVMSDNGPPFNSAEFKSFSQLYEFKHVTSSPGYPQSNGKAESAVKILKSLMIKAQEDSRDPYLALLDWRNTPTERIGSSPAQRLFGRRTKTLLPTSSRLLVPETVRQVPSKLVDRQQKQATYYNRTAQDLKQLSVGDNVYMAPAPGKHKWIPGVITSCLGNRSYLVRTDSAGTYRRNRRHLRLFSPGETCSHPAAGSSDDDYLYIPVPHMGTREERPTQPPPLSRSPYQLRSRSRLP